MTFLGVSWFRGFYFSTRFLLWFSIRFYWRLSISADRLLLARLFSIFYFNHLQERRVTVFGRCWCTVRKEWDHDGATQVSQNDVRTTMNELLFVVAVGAK